MRRRPVLLAPALVGLLTLSACGAGGDEQGTDTAPATEPAPTPADDAPTDPPAAGGEASSDEPAAPADEPPAEAPAGADAPVTPAPETPATEPPSDDAPPATEAEPPPETTPVEQGPPEAVIGGRSFAPMLDPAADVPSNPLPDLVVRDVGRDQDANIRNIFPADRPVLLWTWAPH